MGVEDEFEGDSYPVEFGAVRRVGLQTAGDHIYQWRHNRLLAVVLQSFVGQEEAALHLLGSVDLFVRVGCEIEYSV